MCAEPHLLRYKLRMECRVINRLVSAAAYPHFGHTFHGIPYTHHPQHTYSLRTWLFTYTKAAENFTEQVISGDSARDLAQRILRAAQFFGDEFRRPVP